MTIFNLGPDLYYKSLRMAKRNNEAKISDLKKINFVFLSLQTNEVLWISSLMWDYDNVAQWEGGCWAGAEMHVV